MTSASAHRRSDLEHRAELAAARLPGLLVAARRIAATVSLGSHGRRQPGVGESFWQFRPYSSDDTPHAIDWRQSAKSDAVFVREREWISAQTVSLWCDLSPSMHFRSRKDWPTKAERAATLILALGILLIEGGEKVVRLKPDGSPAPGASTGRLALSHMAEQLALDLAQPGDNETPVFSSAMSRHGTTILVSDFLAPIAEITANLAAFAARTQSLHLVQVLDPAEETLPFSGRVRFEGLENDGEFVIDRVEDARDAYIEKLTAHREALRALAASQGWSFAVHRTDMPPHLTLVALHRAIGERDR
jgi:uncharacterized protein (DUF58 family)